MTVYPGGAPEKSRASVPDLRSLVEGLTAYLETLRETGVKDIELDRETLHELGLAPVSAIPAPTPSPTPWREAAEQLAAIAREIAGCRRCPLHQTRTKTVPGQGCPQPDILFVGEGPGRDEDLQGLAFVGRAGALLTRMIKAMGLTRDEVFIANIVKCRPTVDGAGVRDRPPTPEEMAACLPYLRAQIAVLRPRVIITLGATALEGLLGLKGIKRQRGQWREYEGIPLMPTYHPSYLLRGGGDDTARYWEVWDDLVAVLTQLGRPTPMPAAVQRRDINTTASQ